MSDSFDTGSLPSPYRRKDELTANQQWMFGGVFAGLLLVGFAFGLYAGAPPRPKATELADAKGKEISTVAPRPAVTPVTPAPTPAVKKDEPKPEPEPKKVEPEPAKPEPKKTEPEPKKPEPKKPDPPTPKKTEPEPKKPDREVSFAKEIAPLMRKYCNECHGASAGKPKGGVDTTTLAKIMGSKGPPLVAGKPADSPLYATIKSGEMPPDGKKPPDEAELKLIHDWIAGGAKPRRAVRGVRRRKCG